MCKRVNFGLMGNPFEEILKELTAIRQENAELRQIIFAMRPKDEEFMTPKQTCTFLGIGATSRWRYEKEGKIKSQRIGGKILYKKSDLENLINK